MCRRPISNTTRTLSLGAAQINNSAMFEKYIAGGGNSAQKFGRRISLHLCLFRNYVKSTTLSYFLKALDRCKH